MNTQPTLADVLEHAIDSKLASVHVALPGIVTSFDAEAQTVSVQPGVKTVFTAANGEEVTETLPEIYGVPLSYQRGGGYFMSFPMQKGDPVLLVFCERSIDQYRIDGKLADPGDLRRFSLSDAVAIPGAHGDKQKLTDVSTEDMVMGRQGGAQVTVKKNGEIHLGADPGDFVALAEKVLGELRKIANAFNTHSHVTTATVGATAVPGVLTPPSSLIGTPGPVAASKVKAQ